MAFPEPGSTWAGFRIESQIGAGGFGRVYAAWDPDLERRVAVKILNPEHLDSTERERFLRESRVAGALDHPRILPIHQASEHDGVPYIVMRYVGGGDLRSALRQGPLTAARTASVTRQVAEALDRAHRGGLVHRDVKPANVLCAEDSDDVYLTDFGITRPVDQSGDHALTRTGRPPASPHYASPEQLRGDPVDPTTDVYSLGCTVFECLTGRVPFPGDSHIDVSHDQVHAEPPTVTRYRPDLAPAVDRVVGRAMAKDPAARYATAGAFAEALGAALAAEAPRPHARSFGATDRPVPSGPVVGPVRPAPDLPAPSRSVFDDATAPAVAPGEATRSDAPPYPPAAGSDDDDTRAVDVVTASGVVEVDWDGWDAEDEPRPPRSRALTLIGAVLAVAALIVGGLVYRAATVDGGSVSIDGAAPSSSTTTPTAPTLDELAALVPEAAGDCNPAPEGTLAGGSVQLVCTRDEAPTVVTFTLLDTPAARDTGFDDLVDVLEVGGAGVGECALGDLGVHGFVGAAGGGQVACRAVGNRVDIVWTVAGANLLGTAGGDGPYAAQYRFWADLVGRTDDTFPMPAEQALLDQLPDDLTENCQRDLGLTLAARADAAVACSPDKAVPDVISWVVFGGPEAMGGWMDTRRASLSGTVDSSPDACDPDEFGKDTKIEGTKGDDDDDKTEDEIIPAADVGSTTYGFDGSTGVVLCFVNSSGQNVLFWTRDSSRIGSIAVSDDKGSSMKKLLDWFRDGGYRP